MLREIYENFMSIGLQLLLLFHFPFGTNLFSLYRFHPVYTCSGGGGEGGGGGHLLLKRKFKFIFHKGEEKGRVGEGGSNN